ncbi:FAD-binding oxidoreductase [Shewanella sp. YIC-542]|uniref:FAD-binding oxidoreductase n=1 Tax=Shewanella mytili TaxID=3377111 RepID=UPI00398EE629
MTMTARVQATAMSHLAATPWQQGKIRLVCSARWQETADVVSFRFRAVEPVTFLFKPGQFLIFHLDIGGELLHRAYTIASSPSRPHSLMVTIKRVPGGKVSNYLLDHLQPGHRLQASGPHGDFNLIDIPAERYLFLSAGCGITPIYSMSRFLTDTQGSEADICCIHSARSREDMIFHDGLSAMAQHHKGFSLGLLLQHEAPSSKSPLSTWHSGHLDVQKLTALAPDFHDRTVYVCGPERFMAATRRLFATVGFDMCNYHQESFTGNLPSPTGTSMGNDYGLRVDAHSTRLAAEQTLLDGIESMQLPIIAACRSGVCGACKCKVVKGHVASSSTQTLTAKEIAQGMVLACSSTPLSDVELLLTL